MYIWLRNICITKKCVFNNLKKITHYYNNGFEEDIYICTYIYIYREREREREIDIDIDTYVDIYIDIYRYIDI